MPVDVKIGTVETNLTATSLVDLDDAEMVKMVKEELRRERELDSQRAADRSFAAPPAGRRL